MDKRNKIILIGITVATAALVVLSMTSCEKSQPSTLPQKSLKQVHSEAWKGGKESGYIEGHAKGKIEGRAEGKKEGRAEGVIEGYMFGWSDGQNDAIKYGVARDINFSGEGE